MRRLFLATILFLCCQLSQSTTYHVDTAGNDSRNGLTTQTAWQTVARVNTFKFAKGDTVLFKRGQTWRGQLNVSQSITLDCYGTTGGNIPVLFANNLTPYCLFINNCSNVVVRNLYLQSAQRSSLRVSGNCSNLTFMNVVAFGSPHSGFEFDAVKNVVMNLCQANYNRSADVGDGYQFKTQCSNIQMNNCKASYNSRRGAQFDTGIQGFIRIVGGEYHHQNGLNQSDGMAIDANNALLIDSVWNHDNGIKTDCSDGLQISGGCKNFIIRNSRFQNNYNAGIIVESSGGTISNNISTYNRHGIAVEKNDVGQLNILNNTCVNDEFCLFFYDNSPITKVNVQKNIFYGSSSTRRAMFLTKGLSAGNILMDNNCLWGETDSFMIEWNGRLYKRSQFSSFQKDTGSNKNSLCADPQFVDVKTNFALKSTSPCIAKKMGYQFK